MDTSLRCKRIHDDNSYGVVEDVTCKEDQQEQNPEPPEPSPSQGCELFGLQEVRSSQAAARGVFELRLREPENHVEAR